MKLIYLAPFVLLGLVLTGCQSNSTKHSESTKTIVDAENKLALLIKDKSCDATFQCRVIAYGERGCGGPSRFDIYSIKMSKQEEVEYLTNEITLFEKSYNQHNNTFSTCEHTIPPQTLCIAKSCQLIKRAK